MKGVKRADQNLGYYSILRKTVKRSQTVVLYPIKNNLFSVFSMFIKNSIIPSESDERNSCYETAGDWTTKKDKEDSTSTEGLHTNRQPTLRGP
jgi:hypothetical protein